MRHVLLAVLVTAVALVVASCNVSSPTSPAQESPSIPASDAAVVAGGLTAAAGKADPPPLQCEGLEAQPFGLCVAFYAQNCDENPNRPSCQQITANYEAITGETPPWLDIPGVCPCDYGLLSVDSPYWGGPGGSAIKWTPPPGGCVIEGNLTALGASTGSCYVIAGPDGEILAYELNLSTADANQCIEEVEAYARALADSGITVDGLEDPCLTF